MSSRQALSQLFAYVARPTTLFVCLGLSGVAAPAPAASGSVPAVPELAAQRPLPNGVWLEDLDWSKHDGQLEARQSVKKTALTVGGRVYPHGLGGVGRAQLLLSLRGRATRLLMAVGIDDVEKSIGSKTFEVWVDDRLVQTHGPLRRGQNATVDVNLAGADRLEIIVAHGGHESDWDRFVLGGAQIVMSTPADAADKTRWPQPFRLQPEPPLPIARGRDPRTFINGGRVVGGTPGKPFMYRLPVSGKAPLVVSVEGLPKGVRFDAATRTLRGTVPEGKFPLRVRATGPGGRAEATLLLLGAHDPAARAPTPIMGWNSWNLWGDKVDAGKIRAAADALVSSSLADYGFSFVNIDDGWEGQRNECGELAPNERFGDIKALSDHVHGLGLKIGIYSSPGRKTCGGYAGSYGHEATDARTFAKWHIDLLKYDWCSYDEITPNYSVAEQRRPYDVMKQALEGIERDIVYSVCNYGRGEVWTWGKDVGGSLWRTTSDITDSWVSLDGIGFSQNDKAPFVGPGHVGDLDMLVVGKVGWGQVRPTRLSGNEQILHVTHWAMLASPLLLGCDLADLDPFTMDLLTNSEVLAVDQDALVQAATRRAAAGRTEVWARPLADGSTAVALYNRGHSGTKVVARLTDLGLEGPHVIRDLWQRKDIGLTNDVFESHVPQHGAVLIKLTAKKASAGAARRSPQRRP